MSKSKEANDLNNKLDPYLHQNGHTKDQKQENGLLNFAVTKDEQTYECLESRTEQKVDDEGEENQYSTLKTSQVDTNIDMEDERRQNYDTDSMFAEEEQIQNSRNLVYRFQTRLFSTCKTYSGYIGKFILFLCVVIFTIYFGFAISLDVDRAKALIIITAIVLLLILYTFVRDHFGNKIYTYCWEPCTEPIDKHWGTIQWFLYPGIIIGVILYVVLAVVQETRQLQSISGIVILISFTYITSKYPDRITWRPVIWGYALQFFLAIFVLRWEPGYKVVRFLSDEIVKFINYSFAGAATVFGDPWMIFHPFCFIGGAMIIYMGAVLSILYYYGLTQRAAAKMAWLMQKTMGTTAIETLGVASNIFLNGMDTMLMLQTYLDKLTPSEFHCFLVGGHSTVAGFIFGFFVLLGAPPQHLLSAAVMSAPAVIAITKLNYPETRTSITSKVEEVHLEKSGETNVFEACANGASVAGKTVAAVMVNYVAFMSLLAFVNATLSWLGAMVNYPELSFEIICSYIFWPIAVIIGVDISECREVAKLIGIKVFTTEVLAYQELGNSVKAGLLNDRSRTLATYALCGFSSLSTLAVAVGIWTVVCPQRVSQMASQMFRALVNANVSCFMTASISGLMYKEDFSPEEEVPLWLSTILGLIPGYKDLVALVPGFGS